MRKQKLQNVIITLVLLSFGVSLQAATVSQTNGDAGVVMGSLINNDGDDSSIVAMSHTGYPSLPYMSTPWVANSTHYSSGLRRGIAEYSLDAIKSVSVNSADVQSSKLSFYFDDNIYESKADMPWVTQDFTLEVYASTANGTLDGIDADDADSLVGGVGSDDWSGDIIASYNFIAGDAGVLTPGGSVVGIYGPGDYYPNQYGDAHFQIYGMMGFEVDVTSIVAGLVDAGTDDYIGFRWIANDADGHWTSMDPDGYLPTLTSTVVPEPATMTIMLGGAVAILRKRC